MIRNVDHVGIAVNSLEESLPFWAEALGLSVAGMQTVESEGVRVAFLPAGRTCIELLEASSETSPIKRHLDRRGAGIHHLTLEVDDLDAMLERVKSHGIELIGAGARAGANGHRVAFLHPRSTGGVLVELLETASDLDVERVDDIAPGAAVLVYMRDPSEKMWGLLRRLDGTGVTLEGLDLGSFDHWIAQLDAGEPPIGGPSIVFVPIGRIEKILLDQPTGEVPSLVQRVERRVSCSLQTLLARGRSR